MSSSAETSRPLNLLAAQALVGEVDVDLAVGIASDALVSGADGPAVVEVAALPWGTPWSDASGAILRMLDELGIPRPTESEAPLEILADIASRFSAGAITVPDFNRAFWRLFSRSSDDSLGGIAFRLDEWEESVGQRRQDLAQVLRREAQDLAARLLRPP